MEIEEIKRRAELYSALAEGKTIQILNMEGNWVDVEVKKLNYIPETLKFRIKPESKYRPFKSQEECRNEMHKHLDFGWLREKESGYLFNTMAVFNSIKIKEGDYDYPLVFKRFEFLDGTPFGIKKEE